MLRGGNRRAFGRGAGFLPSQLGNLAFWHRKAIGQTIVTGVSRWADQSGNARDLLQATGTMQPLVQADLSLLFDGSNDFLQVTGGFTLVQPITLYMRAKQVVWTNGMRLADGNTANSGAVFQNNVTPEIDLFAGGTAAPNTNLLVGAFASLAVVLNGASSVIQVNNTTPTTGNAGAANMGGLTIGASGAGTSNSNIQVMEVIGYAAAHNQATRTQVNAYLATL